MMWRDLLCRILGHSWEMRSTTRSGHEVYMCRRCESFRYRWRWER